MYILDDLSKDDLVYIINKAVDDLPPLVVRDLVRHKLELMESGLLEMAADIREIRNNDRYGCIKYIDILDGVIKKLDAMKANSKDCSVLKSYLIGRPEAYPREEDSGFDPPF